MFKLELLSILIVWFLTLAWNVLAFLFYFSLKKKGIFILMLQRRGWGNVVLLRFCMSVRLSVSPSVSPSVSSIFFLYAFKEKYETCWIASNCKTTDQVDTFVACSLHIFQKIILYIPFFCNVLVRYRVRCVRKKGRFILYY